MTTIIIGGGIIGLSTAYYLTELEPDRPAAHEIHIIDSASELFLSASGHAGGFLAKDWFSSPVASLGELSFRLHRELAAAHNGSKEWGYASSTAYNLAIDTRGTANKVQSGRDAWLQEGGSRSDAARSDQNVQEAADGGTDRDEMLNADGTPAWFTKQEYGTLNVINSRGGCAQIIPKQLCEWLLQTCEARGVKIHTGCEVTGLVTNVNGEVDGIEIKKHCEIFNMHCKSLVIAAGAWTPRVFRRVFQDSRLKIRIRPLAGYSIVVRSPRLTKPIPDPLQNTTDSALSHAVYGAPSSHWSFAPEVFSRIPADGRPELWVGGLNDFDLELPEVADDTAGLKATDKMNELRDVMVAMTGLLRGGSALHVDDLEIVNYGICFRPVSYSDCPIIQKLSPKSLGRNIQMVDGGGVFVASGHGPWGISLSLGTGRVVAEMLTGRQTSADVSKLRVK